jgi:hypothetical protein
MLRVLKEIKETLNLDEAVHLVDKMIVCSCAIQWSNLLELESRHLRRYGEVPRGLGEYLDPMVKALNNDLRAISNAAGHSVRR